MTPLPEDHSDLARMCGAIDYEERAKPSAKHNLTWLLTMLLSAIGIAQLVIWFFMWMTAP